jgi:hypothetical protein
VKKKIIIGAAAAAITLGIAAPAQAATPSYSMEERTYVKWQREDFPGAREVRAARILEAGYATCRTMTREGVGAVMQIGRESGLTRNEAGKWVINASIALCPSTDAKVRGYFGIPSSRTAA